MLRRRVGLWLSVCLFSLLFAFEARTQVMVGTADLGSGPRLVQFSGVLKDQSGQPLSGVQGVTFGLYREQSGGAALWLETQNVAADEQGRYSILL
ncbi:MAG: hypothetical protein HY648_03770, partial [Acidobacteria bacterium]|nr:hypothetical protein [Acidobacteriota bacterium]